MTSILTYIKEHAIEILTIIILGCTLIFGNLFNSSSSGLSDTTRAELDSIDGTLRSVLAGITEYKALIETRDEEFRGFQDYLSGEIADLQEYNRLARLSNLEQGDRITESAIIIDDSLRLINKIREKE